MTRTGEQLCADTDSAVHRFRMEWVEQLVERFRKNPGRPIVHLSDLLDSTMVGLDVEIGEVLREHWERLRSLPDSICRSPCFIGIGEVVRGKAARFARLGSWKLFGSLTGFNVDKLEPHVTRLRISGGRYMRMVEGPKLPFYLATIAGARLIGYQGDANSRNSAFSNKDLVLHEDYENCVRDLVGNINVTRTTPIRGGFSQGTYHRTNVGRLVSRIVTVAGIDLNTDQKLANNPVPLWLHLCAPQVFAACLSALWDAEGSVNFRDLKVSQAAPCNPQGMEIPTWPKDMPYGLLPPAIQDAIGRTPPMLLSSAALLLRRLGIIARLHPVKIYMTTTGPTAYWQLRIGDILSVFHFRDQIRLKSTSKQLELASSA